MDQILFDYLQQFMICTDWNGAFRDNRDMARNVFSYIDCRLFNVIQVCSTAWFFRGTDGNINHFRIFKGFFMASSEFQTILQDVLVHQLTESRLINWRDPSLHFFYFLLINVYTSDLMPDSG